MFQSCHLALPPANQRQMLQSENSSTHIFHAANRCQSWKQKLLQQCALKTWTWSISLTSIEIVKVQSCQEVHNNSQGLCRLRFCVFSSHHRFIIQVMHLSFFPPGIMVLSSAMTCKCAVYGSLELLRPLSTRLGVILFLYSLYRLYRLGDKLK